MATSWDTEVLVVETADGDPVEIRVTTRGTTHTIERSYDGARRFLSERRREVSATATKLTTVSWERDGAGQVRRTERIEENDGGASPRQARTAIAIVVAKHKSGRWLRRETRDRGDIIRTDTRTFDAEGRVATHRTEGVATAQGPAQVITSHFVYLRGTPKPKTETVEIAPAGEAPRIEREVEYDDRGHAVRIHVYSKTENEGLWNLMYDSAGRLVSRLREDGVMESYLYAGKCAVDLVTQLAEPNIADE